MNRIKIATLVIFISSALYSQNISETISVSNKIYLLDHSFDTSMKYLEVDSGVIRVTFGGIHGDDYDNWRYEFLNNYRIAGIYFSKYLSGIYADQFGYFKVGDFDHVNQNSRAFPRKWFESNYQEKVIIPGNDIFLIEGFNFNLNFASIDEAVEYEPKDPFDIAPIHEYLNIKTIEIPVHLTEKDSERLLEYCPENLYQRFFSNNGLSLFMINTLPWAASTSSMVDKNIYVTFEAVDEWLNILNGFVDPNRPYLYKANDRLKRIKILSTDNFKEYELFVDFVDVVYMNAIKLPRPTKSLSISIIDVFPGNKYSDVVVTSITGSNSYSK